MRQKTYICNRQDEIEAVVDRIRREDAALMESSSCVLIHIVEIGMDEGQTQVLVDLIKKRIPAARVAGISMYFMYGTQRARAVTLSVTYMESSTAEVIQIPLEECDEDGAIARIREIMDRTPHLAGVEVIPSGMRLRMSDIMYGLSKGYESLPFFGAMGNVTDAVEDETGFGETANDSSVPQLTGNARGPFSIGDRVLSDVVEVVLYSGPDLYIYMDNLLGWEPMGRPMKVTAGRVGAVGDHAVRLIDGEPAVEIYRKYLGVTPNRFFTSNICEFPLVVERGGALVGRIPAFYSEDGTLYFTGDIGEDDTIRLSYGDRGEILENTARSAVRMARFKPQAQFLIACGNRVLFLKEEAGKEMECFAEVQPQQLVMYGMAELALQRKRGGVLNSALVAVGMREGMGCECQMDIPPVGHIHNHEDEQIPLEERLATFLRTMTGELKEVAKEAKAASRAKSSFLTNMSHEIRTPINAVLGMDEMILREASEQQILEYAENIRVSGNTLLSLVNDILDFSKIEAGKMDIIPVDYQFASVLNDLVTMIRSRALSKGLSFKLDIDPDIPSIMNGDEIRFKQVVTNILTNAVKYTETGSVTLRMKLCDRKVKDEPDRVALYVAVEDTGIGIKEEDLGKLFAAFERIEEKRNRSIEGTGLGMAITCQLLSLMGSRLEVSSTYGKGSVFSFVLEQRVVDSAPIGDYEEALRRSSETREKYHEKFTAPEARILVVDDTPMNLTVIRGLLKKTLITVDTAASGREAIRLMGENEYDLILLDHLMPEMDGIETLHRLKELYPDRMAGTPGICLTANAVSGAREQYLAAGFDEYLTKPIDAQLMEATLLKLLPKSKVKITDSVGEEKKEGIEADLDRLPPFIKSIEAIVPAEGLKFCGDSESYIEALRTYAQSAAEQSASIEQAYRDNNWQDYTIKVHALKSTSRAIGASVLADLALSMEEAAKERDIVRIREHTDELVEKLRRLSEELAPMREKDEETEDPTAPEISADELREGYEALRELAGMFDLENITGVLRNLFEYRLPPAERARLIGLRKAAAAADWDKVREIINSHYLRRD